MRGEGRGRAGREGPAFSFREERDETRFRSSESDHSGRRWRGGAARGGGSQYQCSSAPVNMGLKRSQPRGHRQAGKDLSIVCVASTRSVVLINAKGFANTIFTLAGEIDEAECETVGISPAKVKMVCVQNKPRGWRSKRVPRFASKKKSVARRGVVHVCRFGREPPCKSYFAL